MVTERRRKPKHVSGVHFHDFGAVLDLKKDPQIRKKRSENDTEKQTRKKGSKQRFWPPGGAGRWHEAAVLPAHPPLGKTSISLKSAVRYGFFEVCENRAPYKGTFKFLYFLWLKPWPRPGGASDLGLTRRFR